MKYIQSAGVVTYLMYDKQIVYLLLYHPHGHWDFPKGKIETDESKREAAERELYEEAGIYATIDPTFEYELSYKIGTKEHQIQKTVYFFVGQTEQSLIELSDEHIDYAWLRFKQAHTRLTYKSAQKLLVTVNAFLLKSRL